MYLLLWHVRRKNKTVKPSFFVQLDTPLTIGQLERPLSLSDFNKPIWS